jgi:hypothetical protein
VDVPGFNDDEFTELYDATFPRVDLVGKAANGMRFLIAKEADESTPAGILGADVVRSLIAKGEDGDMTTARERQPLPNGITLSGSPAQIAAFIHAASVRKAGPAPDLPDNADGSPGDPVSKDAAMGPELDGDPDAMDSMDVTVPLAEPEDMAPGDPADPGSPAWESIDAASAQKWLSIAARLKNALCVLAEREMVEAASADPDDIENAWNLEDAMCAVDYAIEQLAVFAACEQAEAELGAEMEAIGKALASFDTAPLGVIEGLSAVRKAGRVLSSANEAAIRAAAESLQKVLASLPEAPIAKEGAAMPATTAAKAPATVAKETATPEAQAASTGPVNAGGTTGMGEPRKTGPAESLPADGPQAAKPGDVPGRTVVKSALKVVVWDRSGRACQADPASIRQQIAKADGDGEGKVTMQAVFDENGNLVGIVDPADITPVAGAGGKPDADEGEPQAGPAAAAADDMTPQPPAEAGTPAEDVAKSGTPAGASTTTITLDVLKSIMRETVAEQIGALRPAEDAANTAGIAGLSAEVETLKAQLAVVAEHPAMPKVFTHGAVPPRGDGPVPPAHQMRGQDHGAPIIDVAKARAMKQRMYTADPAEANAIATELNQSAIATLEAIHSVRRQ